MVITEGTGEIVLDGKTTKVAPGAIMYSAAGKTHARVRPCKGIPRGQSQTAASPLAH